jgi:lysophospholipase L1-like esterase
LKEWSEPALVMAPDEADDAQVQAEGGQFAQFYNMSAFPYGGQFLGLVTHFRYTGPPDREGTLQSKHDGPIDVQLVHSRNGRMWERCEDRSPVIPNGPHAYDAGCILGVTNTPVVVEDELWMYYTAITTTHGGFVPEKRITIALAKWRLDGFASLDAGEEEGVIRTVTLECAGDRLIINADIAGTLTVSVLDTDGNTIPGYGHDDCNALTGDSVRHAVSWQSEKNIPNYGPFSLEFRMKNAQLFSFTVAFSDAQPHPFAKTKDLLETARKPVRIVCFGDSVTGVYYHTGGRRAYADMLDIALERLYPEAEITVINAGISGHTTADALKRIETDVLAHEPHLVTVMFGLNDMVRVPIEQYEANLKTIIDRCRGVGAEVLLCTPNAIFDTPSRPTAKLQDYCHVVRRVGAQEAVQVLDCYYAYDNWRQKDPLSFALLMSDEIHPNMDGHKLFAELMAKAISGREVNLSDVGPPEPVMPKALRLLAENAPIRVYAMPPYDARIAPAIQSVIPNARVEVTAWPVEGQRIAEIEAAAKQVRELKPDLVIVAVPAEASADSVNQYIRSYSWVLNWSLSFAHQQWDCIAVTPGVTQASLTPEQAERDDLARLLIQAQDLGLVDRREGDARTAEEVFSEWVRGHLARVLDSR